MTNPARLYLPLLVHDQEQVQRQAATILLATYGERALTYLRRLLDDPLPDVSGQARTALAVVGAVGGLRVELRPFRGIYVRCLGTLQVFFDSRELLAQDWSARESGRAGARKMQGIFAYLVHCGRRGASRDEIGSAVWGGDVSAVSLSRTLGSLRSIIAELSSPDLADRALRIERDHCTLNPDSYHSDADLFERTFDLACDRENHDGLASAASLYQQTLGLYDGPYMVAVPRGSDWGRERRDLLANNYLIAIERLAELAYQNGNDYKCIALCRQGLHIEPSADDITVWLLRAYRRLGLSVDLESSFQRYLRALGTSPAPGDPVVREMHNA